MMNIESIQTFLRYNDWANGRLLQAAVALTDELLDRPFEMGRGTLRKTLLHIAVAEHVWVQRWKAKVEVPWPNEDEPVGIAAMGERLRATQKDRDGFLATLKDADLSRIVTYRDSLGSLYTAALGDMLLQLCTHSAHHRAQAVNMLRRLGAQAPELDYMYWVRKPAGGD
jgi:uncharacterized damage-inducible protein DinB